MVWLILINKLVLITYINVVASELGITWSIFRDPLFAPIGFYVPGLMAGHYAHKRLWGSKQIAWKFAVYRTTFQTFLFIHIQGLKRGLNSVLWERLFSQDLLGDGVIRTSTLQNCLKTVVKMKTWNFITVVDKNI